MNLDETYNGRNEICYNKQIDKKIRKKMKPLYMQSVYIEQLIRWRGKTNGCVSE